MPWIELTKRDGVKISVNSKHIVSIERVLQRNTGQHTLVVTTARQLLEVAETYDDVTDKVLLR